VITTLKPDHRIVHKPTAVIAATLLVALCGQALAQDAGPRAVSTTQVAFTGSQGSFTAGQSVITSRGPAYITGHIGSMETTAMPGSGGQGFLMNNGNGTSTLIVPGGVPQTVVTPR
jgi:hypothetical protein